MTSDDEIALSANVTANGAYMRLHVTPDLTGVFEKT